MDFEEIKRNLMEAFGRLMATRVIVSSKHEKVADLPALYVLAAVLLAPWVCAAIAVLGLLTRHSARLESEARRM